MGLSLEKHPLALLRPQLTRLGAVTAEGCSSARPGRRVGVGGMVICRQRPPTAKGFCFLSLEDETGIANLVVEPDAVRALPAGDPRLASSCYAEGVLERAGKVVNLKVRRIEPLMHRSEKLPAPSGRVPMGHR